MPFSFLDFLDFLFDMFILGKPSKADRAKLREERHSQKDEENNGGGPLARDRKASKDEDKGKQSVLNIHKIQKKGQGSGLNGLLLKSPIQKYLTN